MLRIDCLARLAALAAAAVLFPTLNAEAQSRQRYQPRNTYQPASQYRPAPNYGPSQITPSRYEVPDNSRPGRDDDRTAERRPAESQYSSLARKANAICVELHGNYQSNGAYRASYREMYDILQRSKRVQELSGQEQSRGPRGSSDRIANELTEIDRQFHELEADMRRWSPDRGNRGRTDERSLLVLMDDFEGTLHDLMDDHDVRSKVDRWSAGSNRYYSGSRDDDRSPVRQNDRSR